MAGRAPQGPDPDDWWATTPVAAVDVPRPEPEEDEDWSAAAPEDDVRLRLRPRPRPRLALARRTRLLIAAAAGALVLLVLGLLAAGVFSSSKPSPTPPTTAAGTTTARTSTPTTTPTPPTKTHLVGPSVTLNPGASGPQTRRLQRVLKSLGDDPGPVDGSYGSLTAKGVEAFQRSAGLTQDGIFGPKTRAALQTALNRA